MWHVRTRGYVYCTCKYIACTRTCLPSFPGGYSSNGLSEEELAASLATVQSLATASGADMVQLRQRTMEGGAAAECLVRRKVEEDDFLEVRYVSSYSICSQLRGREGVVIYM